MDILKLALFLDLAKTKNYTETAEHFFTTQGNVSKKIIALEKELGTTLFDRSHRQIELTESGKITLPFAKSIVEQYQALQKSLMEHDTEQEMLLTIYTIPTLPNYLSFSKISEFSNKHPEIKIQVREEESEHLPHALTEENNPIIFTRIFQNEIENQETLVIAEDEFVVLLPSKHPLATQSTLHLSELKKENFLLLGKSTNLYNIAIDLCQAAGFEPKINYEGKQSTLILNMIASGLGVSIMTKKTVENLLTDHITAVPITPNKTSYLAFIRNKEEHSKSVALFWDFLKSFELK